MFASKDTLLTRPSGGYTIARSVRLRQSASAYLNRTPTTAGNRKTWTWSGWVKRGKLGVTGSLIEGTPATSQLTGVAIGSNDILSVQDYLTGSYNLGWSTSAVYRDPAAWYHVVVSYDTTQASSSNTVKAYVNGVQQTVTFTAYSGSYSQNRDSFINATNAHFVNRNDALSSNNFGDYYLTEINFIDGQALTPSSFGETDAITGVWKPKKYAGTYGTNGFYLNFSDNSNNTAATIGKDYSGNGNNWTPNNISVTSGVTYDSMTDVPTLTSATAANYCVGNPLDNSGTLSSGNLTFVSGGSNQSNRATFQLPSSGKFYAECTLGTTTSASVGEAFGYATASASLTGTPNSSGKYVIYADSTGAIYSNGSTLTSSLGTFASGTVLQIAYDGTTGNAWVGKNNTWYNSSGGTTGDPSTGANPTFTSLTSVFPFTQGVNGTQNLNFGQRPFSYTPPTGFVALNTYNLPASTIKNGGLYMKPVLYTGDGTTNKSITGVGFQTDFNWTKSRSSASYSHQLSDSVRGFSKYLYSNATNAEGTDATNHIQSVNSDGYVINSGASFNASGVTYVAWNWKAGTTSASNTNGSITSTVSAGATQGFSVVTYTGTGANATVGHGLGVAPSMIIVKVRSAAYSWPVWHSAIANSESLYLNETVAKFSAPTFWNSTSPTSTVFSIGTGLNTNDSAKTYVAYCFSAVAGYSAFGSYTGNGSTDGPFVYTGFRPRFILVKTYTTTQSWQMYDSARDTYNQVTNTLFANGSNAEASNNGKFDFLSNGFKMRDGDFATNKSGESYIYMAFAEVPFRSALAR